MFGAWYHTTHSQSVFLYVGLFPLLSYLFLSKYRNHFESFTVSKESDDKAKKATSYKAAVLWTCINDCMAGKSIDYLYVVYGADATVCEKGKQKSCV